jgi:molybdate transport system substrate-binding protein
VFPRLKIANKVTLKMVPRGSDSTGMLAAGEADLVIGPVSELVHQPGVELVGTLPNDVQLIQPFAAAIVATARNTEQAKRLIEFLASDRSTAAIKDSGMTPARDRKQ